MRSALAVLAIVLGSLPATAASVADLDACDARVTASPRDPLSYYCYLQAVRAGAPVDDAVRRLDAVLAFAPDRHRARMILGMIEDGRRVDRAEALLREAVDGMEAQGDHHGVLYGALTLAYRLGETGRLDEAEAVLERAVAAADAVGDLELRASVWTEQGLMARRRSEYGRAWSLYRRAEAAVFPEGPGWLQANVLSGIGWLQWYFGDLRSAIGTYRREARIRLDTGDRAGESNTRFNLAFIAMALADRGEYPSDACESLVEEALAAALAAGNVEIEAYARLLRSRDLPPDQAVAECERALVLAERAGDVSLKWSIATTLAERMIELGPSREDEAFALVEDVIDEARAAGMPTQVVYALESRATLATRTRSTSKAVAAWEACIAAAESVGTLQREDTVRAYTLSHWSDPYHRVVGLLLDGLDRSPHPEEDLERAFRTMERRHARSLRESLSPEGRAPADGAGHDHPTLSDVRSALGDDEVMLVWNVPTPTTRDSWLLAISRESVDVRRLPHGRALDDAITVFEGLARTADPIADRAASDLAATVFADVLDDRLHRTRKAFLLPDGPVHRVPFAALRAQGSAEPIGMHMRLDVIPSAALWMEWREAPVVDGPGNVLSLADPEFAPGTLASVYRSDVGRLPHARNEARGVRRAFHGDARMLNGARASERAVKAADPADYRVLHLAAHAMVDDAHPERSAVLLAPGDGEDGLLRVDEIARLDLRDHVVLLSACRGASGPVVGGEGILGLARAFLGAGARAVLANRWPYRDDHAAAMTVAVSREIGRGVELGDAVTAARRSRAASGAPLGSWAGVTLIGDGSTVAVPAGKGRPGAVRPTILLMLLVAVLVGIARTRFGYD